MAQHLVLTLRLHDSGFGIARYHGISQGAPEWPPAPARLYQALVAGVARGNTLPEHFVPALEWLEALHPPIIVAPRRTSGQGFAQFVPNNDADALPNPLDVSGIRTAKFVQPSLFAADQPILYAWRLDSASNQASTIAEAANNIYQLGRGIDIAWAAAEVLDDDSLEACLANHRGVVHRPEPGVRGTRMLACPSPGSLTSLIQRHRAPKLRLEVEGKKSHVLFFNTPKPRFANVSYERARHLAVYELRDRSQPKPWPWALGRAVKLVETLRDEAAARLRAGIGGNGEQVTRCLVGRTTEGCGAVPIDQRIRIVPLPSIGSVHADRAIRRVMVEVPSGAPLPVADVEWAFSGLDWADPDTGELCPMVVTKAPGDDMLGHYKGPSRRWRSVTPVALPMEAARLRIDPLRADRDAGSAAERIANEGRAVAAIRTALRHAGVVGTAVNVGVQRQPFEAQGLRAEAFAEGTRFANRRLWHVEIELDRAVEGPLVIGDGRFVGLGVLAPVDDLSHTARGTLAWQTSGRGLPDSSGVIALAVHGTVEIEQDAALVLARALRRAVMARVRDVSGLGTEAGLDRFFSGHEPDGSKSRAAFSRHLAFQWDAPRHRLLLIAPHRLERRAATWREREHLRTLNEAVEGLIDLRAGAAGRFEVRRQSPATGDPLLASATRWTSITPYAVTRHHKRSSAAEALTTDVLAECERCGLPRPEVTVIDMNAVAGQGMEGRVQLDFAVAVAGPIALGRTALLGGGLFAASGFDADTHQVCREPPAS